MWRGGFSPWMLILLWAMSGQGLSALEFSEEQITHEAGPEETLYEAVFPFTNESETPVKIVQVRSSCGCTAAVPDRDIYEPGEQGEIKAVFTYGARQGLQRKRISVETDEGGGKQYALMLQVTIPEVFRIEPRVLYWDLAREQAGEKVFRVLFNVENPPKVLEVKSNDSTFHIEWQELEEGGVTVQVKPLLEEELARPVRAILQIRLDRPLRGQDKLAAYAMIKP